MFAIIDIETCGGRFEYRRGHIIEICILIHDGLSVVNKFTSLINPQCRISPMFTRISGITNEMVADAPTFAEVARTIFELTDGNIFVAHNVNFDYGFIKEEFASLGATFKRDTLCTVRLSRKLLPGKRSYSLGNLCEELGIENAARHRAEVDAVATAQLFDILMQLKSTHPQYKNKGVEGLMVRRIDKIKQYILDKLPETCGVYYFLDRDGNIIYIGKSVNAYQRAMSHFNTHERKGKRMLHELFNVDFVPTGSELIALLLESEEIKKHQPKFNRMRKAEKFNHSIVWNKDENGIINFRMVDFCAEKNVLASFSTYASAREKLEGFLEEHELCLRYCGLVDEEAVCFRHHIKKCKGICAGVEAAETYNKRASKIIEQFRLPFDDFVIIDRGKTSEEQSVVLIEDGRFWGYGYVPISESISSATSMLDFAQPMPYFPDADMLVRGWLKQGKVLPTKLSSKLRQPFFEVKRSRTG